LWNCNSIKKHKDEITQILNQNNNHIFYLNETKLKASIKIEFENNEITRKYRNSNEGGVAILIHNSIEYEREPRSIWI